MKRVAITGISGYIGDLLVNRLIHRNNIEKIAGIDLKKPKCNSPKLQFYCQDISESIDKIFLENDVNTAINLAFAVKPTHNKKDAKQTDIGGINNFLDACVKAGVKNILYLSSHTVYGAHPDNTLPLGENAPLRPMPGFQYSWDKAEAERILQDFAMLHEDVCVSVLRSCPVIGPNAARSVVTAMLKPVMIRVAGYDPQIQFVHENDLVEIISHLLDQPRAGIFNVSGDGNMRYSEIAGLRGKRNIALPEQMLRFIMWFSWLLHLQKDSPTSGLEFIKYPPIVSTEKIKREMGFQFGYSCRDALLSFLKAETSSPS